MTRKDYQLIACCIQEAKMDAEDALETQGIESVERRITLELSLDNPRFSSDKFESACDWK